MKSGGNEIVWEGADWFSKRSLRRRDEDYTPTLKAHSEKAGGNAADVLRQGLPQPARRRPREELLPENRTQLR